MHRNRALRFAAASVALLIPIFWHRRIEAGDLASHLYNAWLAQLIGQGRAPGLWLARQYNNVLFDWLLSTFGSVFGLRAAERIAVSLAVLIFFWGAFALIAAATRRPPWVLAPLLAVVAYGWTFEMGFMNYYISLGLCFLALAAFWHGGSVTQILALALIPLIWLAHPLGVVCLGGIAAYVWLTNRVRVGYRRYILLAAGVVLLGVRILLVSHYKVYYEDWALYFFFNGADQLALFSQRYLVLYALFAAVCLFALADDARNGQWRAPTFWDARVAPLQLYTVAVVAALVLPNAVYLHGYGEPLSFLTSRVTSVSAVLICWALAAVKPRKWHAPAYAMVAVVFFVFLYVDTAKLNRLEEEVEGMVGALPPGHRIVEDIDSREAEYRVVYEHIVDRACIGRCFSYSNYEPSTRQFRVRGNPGNSIVQIDPADDLDDATADARVQALNPPAYDVVWCDASSRKLCLRELSGDEMKALAQGDFCP